MIRDPLTMHVKLPPAALFARGLRVCAAVVIGAVLTACASTRNNAPVEERSATPGRAPAPMATPVTDTPVDAGKPPADADNAGKPGYYTVKQGDTLIRIGLETGQVWRDVARWNGIENPNLIEVGQVLRVAPPGDTLSAVSTRAVPPSRVETRPLGASAPNGAASIPAAPASAVPSPPAAVPVVVPASDDDVNWGWPASGPVAAGFDEQRQKGLAITGKAGDPVLAAADGRVVYAGSGLRGYGNLVIVKHNNTYLTAYAHNQTLLVKEDQAVRRGQKIAEMGSSDAERVQLHFEIRKLGRPVDPGKLLPPR